MKQDRLRIACKAVYADSCTTAERVIKNKGKDVVFAWFPKGMWQLTVYSVDKEQPKPQRTLIL